MEKIVRFEPAYEKEGSIGAVRIRFVLKGELGAIQFLLGTDWYTENKQREFYDHPCSYFEVEPKGWDVGYHSPKPMHENDEPISNTCEFLDGRPCYYDGSSLAAEPIRDRLLAEGDAAVWEELERRYVDTFGEAR